MAEIKFPIAVTVFYVLIFATVTGVPNMVQDLTGMNTTALQNDYDVSEPNVDANTTSSTNAVNQASGMYALITNPNPQNQIFKWINIIIIVGLVAWGVVTIWIG